MSPRRLLALFATVLLLIPLPFLFDRVLLFFTHSIAMVAFPWEVESDEGVILYGAWLLAHGRSPYPPPGPDHFVSSIYAPLFYVVNAAALKIWGLNLWSGRLLSLAGTLLAGAALVLWTVAETRSRLAGVVAAALWLTLGPVIVWTTFYKQDLLALGFQLAGGAVLAWALRDRLNVPPQPQLAGLPRLAWVAILPLALAGWTKQSALVVLGAAALYLLARDWRSGLRWSLVAGATLIGPLLIVNEVTEGQLYAHMVMPGAEALLVRKLVRAMGNLWGEHWPIILLGMAVLALLLAAAARARGRPALSAWYAVLSIPAVIWTNMPIQDNHNHLIDGLLPLCLLVGIGLGHSYSAALVGAAWRVLPLGIAVALLAVQPTLFTPLGRWHGGVSGDMAARGARLQLLQQAMADTPGHAVVSEDAWTALRAGKSVPYSDSTQMATQAITGHWDESGFLANVARRKFPLLVLTYDLTNEVDTPRWSPAALAALQANYEIQYRDALFTHVPRPPPDEPPQPLACSLAGGPRLTGLFLPGGGQRLDAGDVQQLSLYWAATATGQAAGELKISLRLVDDRGAAAWQADLAPGTLAGQAWPGWATSATLRDDFHVALPLTAGPGSYTLALSAYRQQGDQFTPLSLDCADGQGGAVRVLARPQVARPWGE